MVLVVLVLVFVVAGAVFSLRSKWLATASITGKTATRATSVLDISPTARTNIDRDRVHQLAKNTRQNKRIHVLEVLGVRIASFLSQILPKPSPRPNLPGSNSDTT